MSSHIMRVDNPRIVQGAFPSGMALKQRACIRCRKSDEKKVGRLSKQSITQENRGLSGYGGLVRSSLALDPKSRNVSESLFVHDFSMVPARTGFGNENCSLCETESNAGCNRAVPSSESMDDEGLGFPEKRKIRAGSCSPYLLLPKEVRQERAVGPHNSSATIVCDGNGDYRVSLGWAATATCGIRDCVRQHDAAFLNQSECTAFTGEVTCETNLLRGATAGCRATIQTVLADSQARKTSHCR
jgi:hypothetical protein